MGQEISKKLEYWFELQTETKMIYTRIILKYNGRGTFYRGQIIYVLTVHRYPVIQIFGWWEFDTVF